MRLATGLVLIVLSIVLGVTLFGPVNRLARLVLIIPAYIGFLACLEGSMSFCVLHAARGTYDFHEPNGFASTRSKTLGKVDSEEWKKLDRRKSLKMHLEALAGAVLLAVLLAFA